MRWYVRLFGLASLLQMLHRVPAFAAGGGSVAPMVVVADSRKLEGILAWWANMYNESHWEFTLMTIIIIPVVGVIFGLIADVIMTWIGIDLRHRDLAEH
jgi:hypothetical protein